MNIYLTVQTNEPFPYINTIMFILPNGTSITIDRKKTLCTYNKTEGTMDIVFEECYLWALNDFNIFGDEGCPIVSTSSIEELKSLIDLSKIELEIEDDAPEGYVCKLLDVTNIE